MGRGINGVILKVLGARDITLTLQNKTEITPSLLRLHFHAPTLFAHLSPGPASWLRFWFPDTRGRSKDYQRAYTIAQARPESNEIDVDFVIHEPVGPASEWATLATAGDTITVQSLGSEPFSRAPAANGLLLFADASSIPAANSIIAQWPATLPITVFTEITDEGDTLTPLAHHTQIEQHNLHHGQWTADDLSEFFARPGWQVWAAGESGSMKNIRKAAKARPGAATVHTQIVAYWIKGKAMGTAREVQPT